MKFFLPQYIFLLLLLPACLNQPGGNNDSKEKPNIIFIMADDLGYGDLGVYGQTLIHTPNIDQLAAGGMLFTDCYAGSTVCAPSRSSLMTGLHTGHTRVRGNANVALQKKDTTIAEVLQGIGYQTGMIGKWGLGEAGSTGIPNKKGFDYFYGYLSQVRAHNYYPEYLWENEGKDSLDNIVSLIPETYAKGIGGIATEKNVYSADKFLEKTLTFLDQHKSDPFFLYLPFTLPHANNEAGYYKQSGMEVPSVGAYKEKNWPYDQQAHAAMITYLDTQVGIIMKKLKDLGLDEKTLVIFTSDNGPHQEGGADPAFFKSGGPLRGIKRDLFEGGIRVPMIARWPGKIQPGSRTTQPVAFWDMLATFCDVAGCGAPAGDGISFLPTLLGKTQAAHKYLYWEFFEQGGKQAVRFDKWKCIRLQVNDPASNELLLFDLSVDTAEEKNIAKEHPDEIRKAISFMNEAHVYSPDFHFAHESPPN